ncbi:MAG: (Fe-S)-binding protein [Kineosporiaceae bacterium]
MAAGPDPDLVADCVHCGFCLPTCPTHLLWGEEMDSPRGRIHLMQQRIEGAPLSEAMVGHWDACLGCMACVTACPSGVRYDVLIEATRTRVEAEHERRRGDRWFRALVFALFPHPGRLRVLRPLLRAYQALRLDRLVRRSGLLRRVSPRLAALERLAPPLGPIERVPLRTPASEAVGRRAVVAMLTGCVQREFFPGVNAATARVLAAEGCDVVAPTQQGCCGALSVHNGREAEAQRYARALVDAFEAAGPVDAVVVNAAGCGSAMKEYGRLLAGDPRYAERAARFAAAVRDVSEFLVELGPVATRHEVAATVAYHDACHLSHAQGIRREPRELLAAVPGLRLQEVPDAEICCGSAGIYNVLHPGAAGELGDRKATGILATGADTVVTANPGCLLQIRSALERADHPLRLVHTVEVLDASIRGADLDP